MSLSFFQRNYHFIALAIMAAGLCLLLYAAIPLGIGLSEDSISYLAASHSLHTSGRMLDIDGSPFVAWAPLYPLVIYALEFFPFKIESSLLVLHAFIYLCLGITTWVLIQRSMEQVFFRMACFAGIILSFTMLQTSASALSEALFLLLVNMVILTAGRDSTLWKTHDLVLLSLFAGFAMLQRYAGLFLILTFAIHLLFLERNYKMKAFTHIWLMLLPALIPLGLWLFRNLMVADTISGFRSGNSERFWLNVRSMLETLTSWILPMAIPLAARLILSVPLLWVMWLAIKGQNKIHAAVISGYMIMLAGCYLFFSFEEPRDRLLSPVFISLFILLFSGAERMAEQSAGRTFVISALLIIWLAYPVARTLKHTLNWRYEGVETYNHPAWRQSQLVNWLKENNTAGKIFSNDAAAVYYFTGKNACRVPKRIYSSAEFHRMAENGDLLVWWNNRDLYDLKTAENIFTLTEKARVDGTVYTIHR